MPYRHKIKVALVRRVKTPEYGPEAYENEYASRVFHFGLNARYTTKKLAMAAALAWGNQLLPYSNRVDLITENGSIGKNNNIKDDQITLFENDFFDVKGVLEIFMQKD